MSSNHHRLPVCDCTPIGPQLKPTSVVCQRCKKTTDVRRLSPTRISVVASHEFCPKCFKILLDLYFKKPFDFGVPAVMHDLDKHQKRLTQAHMAEGDLPTFFGGFKDATKLLPIKDLSCFHADSMIQLYGLPDLVLGFDNGTVGILDNKTARVKTKDHPLFQMYTAQLSFYKYMLEHEANPKTVSKLGLLFHEFSPFDDDEEIIDSTGDDSYNVRFKPKYVDVDVAGADRLVNSILKTVRELLDMDGLPKGRPGCKDCSILKEYVSLLEKAVPVDRQTAAVMTDNEYQLANAHYRALEWRDQNRMRVYFAAALKAAATTPYGVLANWDFTQE